VARAHRPLPAGGAGLDTGITFNPDFDFAGFWRTERE